MLDKNWKFYNPVEVTSGNGCIDLLSSMLPKDGTILIVTTSGFTKRGVLKTITKLCNNNVIIIHDEITPNPELDMLDYLVEIYKNRPIDVIIALGGGSVIDAAKVLSVSLRSPLISPLNAVLRRGKEHCWDSKIPMIAIPTTSGTGAEVTPFATVWDPIKHKKYSVAGDKVYPTAALLDPNLTLTLPREETINTALDAISHSLESLWNKNRTPVSELYARESLTLSLEALPIIVEDLSDIEQRESLQKASLFAGLAISQTRTAIAHSISYPLTSYFDVPHGLACSFTLPTIIERYTLRNENESINELMYDVKNLLTKLNLPNKIKRYVTEENINEVFKEMFSSGRANNFIYDISIDEIKAIAVDSLQVSK